MKKPASKHTVAITIFFVLTVVLLGLGSVFVLEASVAESFATFGDQYYLFRQHLMGLALGAVAFLVGYFVPARIWVKFGPGLYLLSLILLLAVFIPGIGREFNGAHRWISVAGVRLQPVEFLKFALIAFYSSWLVQQQRVRTLLFTLGIPITLILLQPDLGSLLLVSSIAVTVFFLGGGNIKHLLLIGLVAIPLVLSAILTSPYRKERLMTFINPESDPLGASFHIRQITLALGRGGWFGQGLGNSSQKFAYIPEASTDSIFAIIAEELGYIGSTTIILLLFSYLLLGYRIVSRTTTDLSLRYLGTGLIVWIGFQMLLNLSAVVGLVPLTGVPLPFFSYGRSSLIMVLFATGIILQIGKKNSKNSS